jgi:outer membrane protein
MRFISRCLTLLSITLLTSAPYAHAEDIKAIGVVNIQKIMRDSKAANSVREQLKTKQKSFQSELDGKEKALQQEDQALSKQRANLSQDAFNQKVESFRQKAVAARQEIQNKRAQLDKGFSGALGKIQDTTLTIIQGIAKDKGLKLVVSSAQVLYSDTALDITDEVLKKLNSDLPEVSVNF